MTEVFNPADIRYASGELAKENFVRELDYEIVVNERDYWHHMYNQATAPGNEPLDFSLVENAIPI